MDIVPVNFRALYSSQGGINGTYRSLNEILTQSKNCPFRVNNMIELKNITTTSDKNGIWRDMFQLKSTPVLSGVVAIFWNSNVCLNLNDNFWVVSLFYSVSGIKFIGD
jgi:hypothetical protein